jgi:hypothetical protein
LVVAKGYKILEIQEVYQYEVTQYNPDTGENTFLKLKAEACGYPSWVQTPADEDRYVQQFFESEGIQLDKGSISLNASKHGLAKLSQLHVGKTDSEATLHRQNSFQNRTNCTDSW